MQYPPTITVSPSHTAQKKAISDQVTFNKQLTLTQKGFEKLKETLVDTFSKLDLVDYLKDSDKALKSVNVSLDTCGKEQ
jgi:hypothetical protein